MLIKECLQEIRKGRKSVWGNFYSKHLDMMECLLKKEENNKDGVFKLIIEPNGHTYESGITSANFVTICKSPHWGSREGVMITSGIHDATKFDYLDKDFERILEYVQGRFPDRHFKIIDIDKDFFGNCPREVWSSVNVKCDFDETGMINGVKVGLGKRGMYIDSLGLSTIVRNALLRKGYRTLGEIMDLTKEDYIKKIPRIGEKHYEEIKCKLLEHGITIKE